MAGPCLDIFVPQKISHSDELRIHALIESIAGTVDGNDFWIANRPFIVHFGETDEDERKLVIDGWKPRGVVGYCAMCNDQTDHVLFAMLCHRTAQLLEGLIALGNITMLTNDPSVLTFDGRRPVGKDGYTVHPEFLGYWMGHPDFRLIK